MMKNSYGSPVILTGLEGAELIFLRSSCMLLTILTKEWCRVKPRFVPVEEKRFLAQLSTEEWDSRGRDAAEGAEVPRSIKQT